MLQADRLRLTGCCRCSGAKAFIDRYSHRQALTASYLRKPAVRSPVLHHRALRNVPDPQTQHHCWLCWAGVWLRLIPTFRLCEIASSAWQNLMSPRIPSESGHKILAKLSRSKRQPCQERADPDNGYVVHLDEGCSLALERKAPIPARMWVCLVQFRAETSGLSVNSLAETRGAIDGQRVAIVNASYSHTAVVLHRKTTVELIDGASWRIVAVILQHSIWARGLFCGLVFRPALCGVTWIDTTMQCIRPAKSSCSRCRHFQSAGF
jgi:hypothetical protein